MFGKFVWHMAVLFGGTVILILALVRVLAVVKGYLRGRVFDAQSKRSVEVARIIDELLEMDYYHFEHLCRTLFQKQGYKVTMTSRSNDQGVSLRASKDGRMVFVRCKRYSDEVVGRPELQAFIGTFSDGQAHHGFFITTSRFSPAAVQYAKGKSITLVNRDELAEWVDRYSPTGGNPSGGVGEGANDDAATRGRGDGANDDTASREINRAGYPAVCAECGVKTVLPFKPTHGRPVYCRPCYSKRRGLVRR